MLTNYKEADVQLCCSELIKRGTTELIYSRIVQEIIILKNFNYLNFAIHI